MLNSLPKAAGFPIWEGREWLGATCLALGLMHVFLVFPASQPLQSGSRTFLWEGVAKCDLPCARTYACFLVFATPRHVQTGSRPSILGGSCH